MTGAAEQPVACWSCYHYRPAGCDIAREGFPHRGHQCAGYEYEPGADSPDPRAVWPWPVGQFTD